MSVVTDLQAGHGLDLFYVLKITGLPYYICAVYDPFSAARFGGAALALPAGYTAVGGMDLPNETLDQSLTDIIGGIASAEEIKLKLIDFTAHDANGEYRVLARAFSPGIATSTPGGYFELMSDIPTTHTTGDDVSVRSGTITPADGFYTFGTETIEIQNWSAPVAGISTGTITGGRNLFPCSSVYPPIPYHRVVRNETDGGAIGRNILVTPYSAPFSMIGRSAAFYVGALDAAGAPLPENQWQLRLVGKITGRGYGSAGATYEIQIKSVVEDLTTALVAPGLGVARIKEDQILLPSMTINPAGSAPAENTFLQCWMGAGQDEGAVFRGNLIVLDNTGVADDNWTLSALLAEINAKLAAVSPWVLGIPYATLVTGEDGLPHVAFYVSLSNTAAGSNRIRIGFSSYGVSHSFLTALGFQGDVYGNVKFTLDEEVTSLQANKRLFRRVAELPAPSVFIPTTGAVFAHPSRFAIEGQDGSTSQHFFQDQGDGRAFVQFGNGTTVDLTDVDATGGAHLTTGERWGWSITGPAGNGIPDPPNYYVGRGSKATVRQVVLAGSRDVDADAGLFVGRFLASHDASSVLDDLNYYPEGVGLGLNRLLDGESLRAIGFFGQSRPREYVVDSETKLEEILKPILKYYGIAVVWDPETSRIAFRPLRFPTAAGAHAVSLSDDTRTDVNDITATGEDASNVRGTWSLKYGWDRTEEKFTQPTTVIGDNIVKSTEVTWKPETIEDKTLVPSAWFDPFEYLSEVFGRGFLYRQPWMKCNRTLQRVGLTMAPGSYHQVIDQNLVNPFTGIQGVTAADGLYAMLVGVQSNPQRPSQGSCVFLLNRYRKSSLFRSWSPCGLVDYAAADHGYNAVTGVLTMAHEYSSHATNHDGVDFEVGDVVRLIARHAVNGDIAYDADTVVSAVAVDGSTVTVDAGLPAAPTGTELILVLDAYGVATANRRAEVAFQGDEATMIVQSVSGAELHRWA